MKFSNFLQSGFEFTKDEYELRLKYLLFNCLIVCNATLVLIVGVMRFTTGDNLQGFVDFTYVILATLIALLARRSQKFFPVLIYGILILSFVIVSLSYKIAANDISGISWFLILILVSAYLTERKTTYVLFFLASTSAVYISFSMEAKAYAVRDIIYGILPLLVALFFTQFYEARNIHSKRMQRILNEELKKKVQNTTAELSVSEDRFRNLVENLSDWVWETDKYGTYSYSSPSVQQLLGYEPLEIEGSSYSSFLCEVALSKRKGFFEKYFKKNKPFKNQIIKAIHKDGSPVMLEISGQPILNREGEFSGYRGVSRDISERIKAEETRRESQKKLDTLLNATTDTVFLSDPNGIFLSVNNALAERCRMKKEELIGKSIFEISQTESLTERVSKLKNVLATKQPLRWEEKYNDRYLDNSFYPILGDDGEVSQIAVFSKDITKQKQSEVERERLLQAIDQSSETIVITDKDGTIQYVNPSFTKVTGYTSEEAIGQNPRILKSEKHSEEFYNTMWTALTNGETWSGQLINKKKDGSLYTEEVTISPVRDTSRETVNYVAVKRDITAEIKMEETLRQAQKMEAVGIMAGGIAHDFNNNLAIILGNVELSLRSSPANSKITARLEDAKTAALRARDLVEQILIYSRQGTQVLKPVQIDLVIDETLKLLRSTIPTTVKIKKTITDQSQDIIIHADSTQLQEILINFCNNAVHAMDDNGEISITLDVVDVKLADIPAHYERPSGQYAKLRVQDTGSGMSPDTLKRIFDPFYTTKEVGKGTGMGLSVVHGIIETHGGFVVVESTLGKGSTFDVYFPMFEAIKVEEVTINTDLPKGTERILFLDDEDMLAQLGSTILSKQGYQVTTETSSIKALKTFKENSEQFDLVITDQTMPDLCGKDLIKELLTIKPDLPTILCTGYSSKINKAEAKQLGIKAFCLKPLDLSQLVQTARRVLDERQR